MRTVVRRRWPRPGEPEPVTGHLSCRSGEAVVSRVFAVGKDTIECPGPVDDRSEEER